MPKSIPAFLLCLLALVPTGTRADSVVRAIAGYGKTTWGMKPEQVVAAESPRAKASLKPEKSNSGAVGLVKIPSLKVGDIGFSATFWFDASRKLAQVTLDADEQKNGLINIHNFVSVERLLTEKYGPPTYKTDLQPQAEGEHTISWRLPTTTIQLTHAYIPDIGMTILVIKYTSSALAAEDSKDL